MTLKQRLPLVILGIFVLTGAALYINYQKGEVPGGSPDGEVVFCTMDAKMCPDGSFVGRTGPSCEFTPCPIVQMEMYSNDTYGLGFSYPDNYLVTERELGNGERGHFSLALTRKADLNIPPDSEGPPIISIDIYQNNLDKLNIERWLKEHSGSNFKLSNGEYATSKLHGVSAVSYHWSGLYEAEATAFEHKGNIIAVFGQYLSPDDQILKDYRLLVESIQLK